MFLRECLPIVAGEEYDLTIFVEFQLPENMKFLFCFFRMIFRRHLYLLYKL